MTAMVYIIEDDRSIREMLSDLISLHGLRVRAYASAEAFLEDFIPPEGLACILTDVCMPGASGLDLLKVLKRQHVLIPFIVMTGYADVNMAVEAMKTGAIDFIEKPFESQHLLSQIDKSLQVHKEIRNRQQRQQSAKNKIARLTPREKQVMDLLANGSHNRSIAEKLDISPRTVEIHRARIMQKLEASSVSDITRIAIQSETKPDDSILADFPNPDVFWHRTQMFVDPDQNA